MEQSAMKNMKSSIRSMRAYLMIEEVDSKVVGKDIWSSGKSANESAVSSYV